MIRVPSSRYIQNLDPKIDNTIKCVGVNICNKSENTCNAINKLYTHESTEIIFLLYFIVLAFCKLKKIVITPCFIK